MEQTPPVRIILPAPQMLLQELHTRMLRDARDGVRADAQAPSLLQRARMLNSRNQIVVAGTTLRVAS